MTGDARRHGVWQRLTPHHCLQIISATYRAASTRRIVILLSSNSSSIIHRVSQRATFILAAVIIFYIISISRSRCALSRTSITRRYRVISANVDGATSSGIGVDIFVLNIGIGGMDEPTIIDGGRIIVAWYGNRARAAHAAHLARLSSTSFALTRLHHLLSLHSLLAFAHHQTSTARATSCDKTRYNACLRALTLTASYSYQNSRTRAHRVWAVALGRSSSVMMMVRVVIVTIDSDNNIVATIFTTSLNITTTTHHAYFTNVTYS